jgi:hypothetical protein
MLNFSWISEHFHAPFSAARAVISMVQSSGAAIDWGISGLDYVADEQLPREVGWVED